MEIDAIPMVPVEGIVDIGIDARPELPPREEHESLTEVLNPCVVSPIVTVCVRDKRPPPPVQEPSLPRGRTPWFPQSWCDSVHALCTEGQEPRDNDRGPESSTSGKTRAELDEICVFLNRVEIDQCKVTYPPKRKYREFLVCKEDADQRMFACFRTASELTDNGARPAP